MTVPAVLHLNIMAISAVELSLKNWTLKYQNRFFFGVPFECYMYIMAAAIMKKMMTDLHVNNKCCISSTSYGRLKSHHFMSIGLLIRSAWKNLQTPIRTIFASLLELSTFRRSLFPSARLRHSLKSTLATAPT